MAQAIVRNEGDRSVPYFERVAADSESRYPVRAAAVLMLGELHTQASAEAFARLRDAAYAKSFAPPRRDAYTHAQRMAESALMALYVIPRDKRDPRMPERDEFLRSSVGVAEDYSKGSLWVRNSELHMYRVGAEWLPASLTPGPIP
jgi:hypothetical protein